MEAQYNQLREIYDISANWIFQSKQLKTYFPQLTDADLKLETGKENELYIRLETRLNKKRYEVLNIIRTGKHEKHTLSALD